MRSDTNRLYLLKEASGHCFKIGVSVNPYFRSMGLSQDIDLSVSRQVPVQNGDAYKVEKVLHYLYRDYALMQAPSDGFTEWFDIAAWDLVIQFLADNQENLGVDAPEAIEVPEMTGTSQPLRGIERRQRIQQNAAARQARYDDNSVAAAEIFREILLDLATLDLSLGVLPKARAMDDRSYAQSWCIGEIETGGVSGWNGSTTTHPAMKDTPWNTIRMSPRRDQQPASTTHSPTCCAAAPATC